MCRCRVASPGVLQLLALEQQRRCIYTDTVTEDGWKKLKVQLPWAHRPQEVPQVRLEALNTSRRNVKTPCATRLREVLVMPPITECHSCLS